MDDDPRLVQTLCEKFESINSGPDGLDQAIAIAIGGQYCLPCKRLTHTQRSHVLYRTGLDEMFNPCELMAEKISVAKVTRNDNKPSTNAITDGSDLRALMLGHVRTVCNTQAFYSIDTASVKNALLPLADVLRCENSCSSSIKRVPSVPAGRSLMDAQPEAGMHFILVFTCDPVRPYAMRSCACPRGRGIAA